MTQPDTRPLPFEEVPVQQHDEETEEQFIARMSAMIEARIEALRD